MTWQKVKLGEVCNIERSGVDASQIASGTTYVGLENIERSGEFLNVITVQNGDLASTKFRFSANHVLYGKLRPYLSKIARPEFEGVCSTDILPLLPKSSVSRDFIFHFLRSPDMVELAASRSAGANLPRLSPRVLADFEIPLPPLAEQKRLAAILDHADALRRLRRESLARLDELAQSLFLELFGDPATNPKGWDICAIKDICYVKGGKRLPKGAEYSRVPTPFRYIRVTDLKQGTIVANQLLYIEPEVQKQVARYIVNAGDVVISIAGSIGITAPVPVHLDGANLTENAAKLVPQNQGDYNADYLSCALRTEPVQSQITASTGQVTIGKLALFRIEEIKIPLPPLSLQQQFAEQIAELEAIKTRARASLLELDALFASLQARAFAGEL